MTTMPHPAKFLASGIGLSGPRMKSLLREKQMVDLSSVTIYCPDTKDLEATNCSAEFRTMEWIEQEMAGVDLLVGIAVGQQPNFSRFSTLKFNPSSSKAAAHP